MVISDAASPLQHLSTYFQESDMKKIVLPSWDRLISIILYYYIARSFATLEQRLRIVAYDVSHVRELEKNVLNLK